MKFSWNSLLNSAHQVSLGGKTVDFPIINHVIPQGPTPDIIHGLNIQFLRLFFQHVQKAAPTPFIQNI